jgi:hypothetical protein
MHRPDIILGRIARLAGEKRELEERLERKAAELVEAARAARPGKTLEEIAAAAGVSKQAVGKWTGTREEAAR